MISHHSVLLSIISVTFNDPAGIDRTLKSLEPLLRHAGVEVEVLVQNGGSAPSPKEFPAGPQVSIINEPDEGIYDGMNRALRRSRGKFIWFLNGGDTSEVSDWSRLRQVLCAESDVILFFDYYLDFGHQKKRRSVRPVWYINHALPTSHQAILYPGEAARTHEYDLRYRVAGDYAFTAAILAAGHLSAVVHETLASFGVGGTSQQNARSIAIEVAKVQRSILEVPWAIRTVSAIGHRVSRKRRDLMTRQDS